LHSACAVKLVQPYDQKLVSDTESFYKKAASFIDAGKVVSPTTDADRANIDDPTVHPGHFSNFEPKYDELLVDTEALILRGMASSAEIDAVGAAIQNKIDKLIKAELPSNCPELENEFGRVSLTVANYVDLKCMILKWKDRHDDEHFTQEKKILKRGNWESRRLNLFNTILAIQKAEGFKKEKNGQ